ncbi:MAG: SAM-dependent chlorinase/fluorinase [Cyclobacteriaceae bacterium]
MAVITFMSDFGTDDHYVATVKGKILSKNPSQQIVDISHAIKPYDISHAATVLKSVYHEFPSGTVHLVSVDSVKERSPGVAIRLEDHFFVGFNCGLFSMLSEKEPTEIVEIDIAESTFPAKDILSEAAIELSTGGTLKKLGNSLDGLVKLFARQLKVTKREISGNVVNVDHYGNLITNITKTEFDKILEINGSTVSYQIRFGRESFDQTNHFFSDVESGDCYVLFNSIGYLQIGLNKGNASQLLGLAIDAPVHIEFTN